MRNKICQEYITGLRWVARYYFVKCPSWKWFYPYDHAPLIQDLFKFIQEKRYHFDQFELSEPITYYSITMYYLHNQVIWSLIHITGI